MRKRLGFLGRANGGGDLGGRGVGQSGNRTLTRVLNPLALQCYMNHNKHSHNLFFFFRVNTTLYNILHKNERELQCVYHFTSPDASTQQIRLPITLSPLVSSNNYPAQNSRHIPHHSNLPSIPYLLL